MKRTRLRPSFVVVLASVASMFLVAGLVFGLTESARATPAHPAPARMVVFDCPGQSAPLVRPKTFILTCATVTWPSASSPGPAGRPAWPAPPARSRKTTAPRIAPTGTSTLTPRLSSSGQHRGEKPPGEHSYAKLTLILTGTRPRYYDYLTHKWVTAPVTQTSSLLTSPAALSPHA